MSPAQKLLAEALQLDAGQRGALALKLMDSISPIDTCDDTAWIAEIERRARRAVSGEQPGIEFDDAMDQLERDLEL